jgi:hypothetical protein
LGLARLSPSRDPDAAGNSGAVFCSGVLDMTKDDIIKLARQVGYPLVKYDGTPYIPPLLAVLFESIADAEREECAKLCEDEAWRLKKLAVDTGSSSTNTKAIQASNDADAIRARGNT